MFLLTVIASDDIGLHSDTYLCHFFMCFFQVFWLWFFNAVYHSVIFFWFPVAMLYHGLYAYLVSTVIFLKSFYWLILTF